MRRKVLVGIMLVLVGLAILTLSIPKNVSAGEEGFTATVIDTADSETKVYDLYLVGYYWTLDAWGHSHRHSNTRDNMLIKKGESVSLTVPFSDIREMEFEWGETEETSIVTITALSGEKIRGNPQYFSHYYFEGKVDFGDFGLADFSLAPCYN